MLFGSLVYQDPPTREVPAVGGSWSIVLTAFMYPGLGFTTFSYPLDMSEVETLHLVPKASAQLSQGRVLTIYSHRSAC